MRMRMLPCLIGLALAIAIPVHASPDPQVVDSKGDGGPIDEMDILSLATDTSDPASLVFHLTLAAAPRDFQGHDTAACNDGTCVFGSESWRIVFIVKGPDGAFAPALADYNRSYVIFRNGPQSGDLTSPIGWFDSADVLTLDGSATVTVDGATITYTLPRDNPAVNIPAGAAPGAYTVQAYAYDSPQGCGPAAAPDPVGALPVQCAPLYKPVAEPTAPDAGYDAVWDYAPDAGYGNATAFPAPAASTTTTTTTSSTTSSATTSAVPTTTSSSTTSAHPTTTSSSSHATTPVQTGSTPTKKSPAVPVLASVAVLGVIALRRRLP